MKTILSRFKKISVALVLIGLVLLSLGFGVAWGAENVSAESIYTESIGAKPDQYLVQDINALERPYNYLIGGTTYSIIEILGVLALLGIVGVTLLHGLARYVAALKKPKPLIEIKVESIYGRLIRLWHWANAITILGLIITGFLMHYAGASHALGLAHNRFGYALVVLYGLFLLYEIVTGDFRQYIPKGWELKEGILTQAKFYLIGIFKREDHPYHMVKENRLNPLQKPAYAGIMFGLIPVVGFTGFVLLRPDIMGFFISWIGGQENVRYIFIIHLIAAFATVAFLAGHLYLATTGDKVKQHYEVMITGKHRVYKEKL